MKKKANLKRMEALHGRILQLQKITGGLEAAGGDVSLLRSTNSGSCSSNSGGGCTIDCNGNNQIAAQRLVI